MNIIVINSIIYYLFSYEKSSVEKVKAFANSNFQEKKKKLQVDRDLHTKSNIS